MLQTVLIVLLILALLGGIPAWGLAGPVAWGPTLLLVIVLILLLVGMQRGPRP